MGRACIYDENDKEVEGFKVFSVNIKEPTRVIGSPIENGQTSFDNKVIDPRHVIVKGTIVIDHTNQEYFDAIDAISSMINSRAFKFFQVCNGELFVEDLILQTNEIDRNVEKFDFLNLTLEYVQALKVQRKGGSPSNAENSNTRSIGFVQGVQA